MAPKKTAKKATKPAPKAALKAALKPAAKPAPKAAVKPAAVAKKSNLTVWPSAEAHTHHHDHASCCAPHGTKKGFCACITECCPIAAVIFTRTYWASAVMAFFAIFATDWLLHSRFLVADYAATSALWRAEGEIQHELIFATQGLTALAYAAIILAIGKGNRWWGTFSSGMLAASVAAISAFTSYVMLPFASPYIPAVWAVASILQGGLVGLAVCATVRISRAPEGEACCGHDHHGHHHH